MSTERELTPKEKRLRLQYHLNSQRTKSITDLTESMHDSVAEIYEGLMDGDELQVKKSILDISKKLKEIKFD